MTTEHLWQLRYQGKVTGYLRWRPGRWQGSLDGEQWQYVQLCNDSVITIEGPNAGEAMILFDAMHDFVCKDRKGRNVFEEDTVKYNENIFTVRWCSLLLRWDLERICPTNPDIVFAEGIHEDEIELAEEGAK